jgi:hypothetical protein
MKKQTVVAFVLLLLIPIVMMVGGLVFSVINPEIAAGHPNYARNFQYLTILKLSSLLASFAVAATLWLLVCFLVIRSKGRSLLWLFFAALGPLGFAILVGLKDKAARETDRYTSFVRSLNSYVRVGYEVCIFLIIWELAYQGMVLKHNLMILFESAATGVSTAQIINVQNASSGMWAFGEGLEVMYLVVFLYLLWPSVFNIVGHFAAIMATPKVR